MIIDTHTMIVHDQRAEDAVQQWVILVFQEFRKTLELGRKGWADGLAVEVIPADAIRAPLENSIRPTKTS